EEQVERARVAATDRREGDRPRTRLHHSGRREGVAGRIVRNEEGDCTFEGGRSDEVGTRSGGRRGRGVRLQAKRGEGKDLEALRLLAAHDQEIHTPNILRRGYGIRARLQPVRSSRSSGRGATHAQRLRSATLRLGGTDGVGDP